MKRLYFAYGSNLNRNDLQSYVEQRGGNMDCFRPIATAVLPDHRLHFSRRSITRQSGVLNVVPAIGQVVEGVLFEVVADEGWDLLDAKEGAPRAYRRQVVRVLDWQGGEWEAITYVVPSKNREGFCEPNSEYVDVVLEGLRQFDLSTDPLEAAARNAPSPALIGAVFCYGTFMRGEREFAKLAGRELECAILASAPGRLVSLGERPGMVLDVDGESQVTGDFIRPRDITSFLMKADKILIANDRGMKSQTFSRRLTHVHVGDGRFRPAWVYIYADCDGDRLDAPGWREHRGIASRAIRHIVRDHLGQSPRRVFRRLVQLDQWGELRRIIGPCLSVDRICRAIQKGVLSERRLAQASNKWTAFCNTVAAY